MVHGGPLAVTTVFPMNILSATVSKKLQEVFGCKPFAGKIMTWSEVASRLIYVAFLGPKEVVGVLGNPGAIGLGIRARLRSVPGGIFGQISYILDEF